MRSTHRASSACRWTGLMVALAIGVGTAVSGTTGAGASGSSPTTATCRPPSTADSGQTPSPSHAGVHEVRIAEICPAFRGRSFGTVGRYERVRGTILGSVDPADPRNAPIADLANAPRNGRDSSSTRSSSCCCDRSTRRGATTAWSTSRRTAATSCRCSSSTARHRRTIRPRAVDAGNGFLMRQGYSLMTIAWDPTVADGRRSAPGDVPGGEEPRRLGDRRAGARGDHLRRRSTPSTAPVDVRRGDARQVTGDADGPPPLRRCARRRPAVGLGLQRRWHGRPPAPRPGSRSSRASSTSSRYSGEGSARRRARLRRHP